jgi:hypothetical protein
MRKLVLAFLLTVPVANGQNSRRPVSLAKPDRTLTLLGRYEVIGERKTSRRSSTAISLVAFLWFPSALSAQRARVPTLEEILQRIEAS